VVQPDSVTFASFADCFAQVIRYSPLPTLHFFLQDKTQAQEVSRLFQQATTTALMNEDAYALFACAFTRINTEQGLAFLRNVARGGEALTAKTFVPLLLHLSKLKDKHGLEVMVEEMKRMGVKRNIAILRIHLSLLIAMVYFPPLAYRLSRSSPPFKQLTPLKKDVEGGTLLLNDIQKEGISLNVNFVNFYTPFLTLLATQGETEACTRLLTELKLQYGVHTLGKFHIYASLYQALLASPRTRKAVLHMVENGVNNTQEIVDTVLQEKTKT
jgi:hypothetical protein